MADPYTDEELTQGVRWDLGHGLHGLAETAARIGATFERMMSERTVLAAAFKQAEQARDEARRQLDQSRRDAAAYLRQLRELGVELP